MSTLETGQIDQTIADTALLRVAKGGALLVAGAILSRLFGFLRQFIVIRILSPADYGLFALSLAIALVIAALSSLGLHFGAQRFVAFEMEKNDLPKVKGAIQTSFRMATATSLFFMIMIIVFAAPLAGFFGKPELKSLLLMLSPVIPLQVIVLMMTSYFLGLHRPAPQAVIQDIGFGLLSVVAVFASLFLVRSVLSAAFAISVAFFLTALVAILFYHFRYPLDFQAIHASPMAKTLLRFSLPLFLYSILYVVMGNTDTVVIGRFLPSSQVGFYNAAFLLTSSMPIFYVAISAIYLPVATSLKAREAQAESLSLYRSSTRWVFIFTLPLFLILFLFPAQTLTLLFGSEYVEAATALWILSIGAFVGTLLGPNGTALIAFDDTRAVLYASISATIIDIFLCLLLVPRMGISGAAISTASAMAVASISYSIVLWIKHKLHPFKARYMLTVIFLITMGVALYKPLRAVINREGLLILAVYPLFLILSLAFIVLTRSITEEDKVLLRAARDRLRR